MTKFDLAVHGNPLGSNDRFETLRNVNGPARAYITKMNQGCGLSVMWWDDNKVSINLTTSDGEYINLVKGYIVTTEFDLEYGPTSRVEYDEGKEIH